jgi:hypothetical protein
VGNFRWLNQISSKSKTQQSVRSIVLSQAAKHDFPCIGFCKIYDNAPFLTSYELQRFAKPADGSPGAEALERELYKTRFLKRTIRRGRWRCIEPVELYFNSVHQNGKEGLTKQGNLPTKL